MKARTRVREIERGERKEAREEKIQGGEEMEIINRVYMRRAN